MSIAYTCVQIHKKTFVLTQQSFEKECSEDLLYVTFCDRVLKTYGFHTVISRVVYK